MKDFVQSFRSPCERCQTDEVRTCFERPKHCGVCFKVRSVARSARRCIAVCETFRGERCVLKHAFVSVPCRLFVRGHAPPICSFLWLRSTATLQFLMGGRCPPASRGRLAGRQGDFAFQLPFGSLRQYAFFSCQSTRPTPYTFLQKSLGCFVLCMPDAIPAPPSLSAKQQASLSHSAIVKG